MLSCLLLFFFSKLFFFLKIRPGIPSKCQAVWIQTFSFCLAWVQTVFKSYQQTALEGKEFCATVLTFILIGPQ